MDDKNSEIPKLPKGAITVLNGGKHVIRDTSSDTIVIGTLYAARPKFETLEELELKYIVYAMEHFKGNKTKASNALGITIKTLYNKLHAFGLFEKYAKSPKEE